MPHPSRAPLVVPEGMDESSLPLPLEKGVCWHYTGAAGLLGIVAEGTILASSPRSLNDSTEFTFGLDQLAAARGRLDHPTVDAGLRRFVDEVLEYDFIGQLIDRTFVFSASLDGDLLNQWLNYSHVDGFAIGLDLSVPLRGVYDATRVRREGPRAQVPPFVNSWYRVLYDERAQQDAFLFVLLNFVAERHRQAREDPQVRPRALMSSRHALQSVLAQIKHPAFRNEQEVRFISGINDPGGEGYRSVGGRLVPFVPVAPRDDGQPLPVVAVRCGPGSRPRSEEVVCGRCWIPSATRTWRSPRPRSPSCRE